MKESFQQNSMLSLCTLSTVSTLNTLPSLSLKLYDIMIMKRPEVSLTLHDLKSAFESIAQLRCCFRQDDVSVCSIKMSGEKFDDSGLNYCNWSVDTYTGYDREDEPEPEYKTTLSIRWSSSTLLNRVVVLEYNCVPSIRRRKGLRPDADAIVTAYGVPHHNLKLINVDTVLKNSNLTVCPSHCLRCNLRRCGKCYPCKDCPFCSKSVCKNCSYKYKCDFCSAWCCRVCKEEDEDELDNPRSSSWQCSKCLKIKCENCQSGEEWLPTHLECCEKSLCHDCSSEREIFTCPSCLYSNCDECSNLEVSKCQKCGEIGCQNCRTAECCGKCYQALCKKCDKRFECICCGCCLCQSCGETSLEATFTIERGGRVFDRNWHYDDCNMDINDIKTVN